MSGSPNPQALQKFYEAMLDWLVEKSQAEISASIREERVGMQVELKDVEVVA